MRAEKLNEFKNFIVERREIAIKKNMGIEPPWTDDPILSKYKFCNIFRKEDACTKEVLKNICLEPRLSLEKKVFNIIIFRRFNVRNFFSKIYPSKWIFGEFEFDKLIEHFDNLKKYGFKLFNDAYTLCQVPYDSSFRKTDKHVQILMSMRDLKPFFKDFKSFWPARALFNFLQFKGHRIGEFLAFQILLDISYCPEVKITELEEFDYVGPGAIGGLEEIFGNGRKDYGNMLKELSSKRLFSDIEISITDLEACLCEFRKYLNLKKGFGRKRYYKHKGANNELF